MVTAGEKFNEWDRQPRMPVPPLRRPLRSHAAPDPSVFGLPG